MRIETDQLPSKGIKNHKNTVSKATPDFQTIYANKVKSLWQDFAESGLTPAEQALKKAGGEEALEIKRSREKKKKDATKYTEPADLETIQKHMPDGSILVLKIKNGKIMKQYRKKPKITYVPDFLHTPKEALQGAATTKLRMKKIPQHQLLED